MMINVKSAEPKVFITCDINKERDLCDDVLNILFSYGIEASCEYFYGRGFSVVYLEKDVDSERIVKYIVSRYVRGYWVIPIDMVCRSSYEDISRRAINAILLKGYRLPLVLIGVCRKRGNYIDSCSNLLRYVGEMIEGLGIAVVDFKNYTYILRLEIVYDKTFISVYGKENERIFKVART